MTATETRRRDAPRADAREEPTTDGGEDTGHGFGRSSGVAQPTWYDPVDAWEHTFARESCRCEACGASVAPDTLGDHVARLRLDDFRAETHVLLCSECRTDPYAEWSRKVRAKRRRERERDAEERFGSVLAPVAVRLDDVRRYVTDPTARSLFGRRLLVAAASVAAVGGATVAGLLVLLAALSPPVAVETAEVLVTAAGTLAAGAVANPWPVAVGFVGAYALHAAERDANDPRGDRGPTPPVAWKVVGGASAVAAGAVGVALLQYPGAFPTLATVAAGGLPALLAHPTAVAVVGVWSVTTTLAAAYIGASLRSDGATFFPEDWNPSYTVWLTGVRGGGLLGALALTLGVPAPAGAVYLLAMTAPVAGLAYVARRLPHDRYTLNALFSRYESARSRLPGLSPPGSDGRNGGEGR